MISAPLQPTQTAPQPKPLVFGNGFSRADAYAIFAVLMWGINVVFTKAALSEIDVLAFMTVRILLSALLAMLALVVLERTVRIKRRDLVPLGLLGLLGVGLAQLLFIVGLNLSLASHGSLLLGANPVFAAVLASWLGWDQFKRRNWFGVALCLVGLALLTGIGSTGFSSSVLLGDALVLLGAFFGASYTVLSKRFLADYTPLQVLAYGLAFSCLPLLALGAGPILAQDWSAVSPAAFGALGFSVLFGTVVGSVLWLKSITHIGIIRTSLYQYLFPVVGVILAVVLLNEGLNGAQWVGAAIVLVGIFFARGS